MSWTAKITGDMTLSVLDDSGFKVLGVDMLRMNTMQAGDGGESLARTLNDLRLLAQAASAENSGHWALADPSAGLSPRAWETDFQQSTRRLFPESVRGTARCRPKTRPAEQSDRRVIESDHRRIAGK